jgi:hypothetical protein
MRRFFCMPSNRLIVLTIASALAVLTLTAGILLAADITDESARSTPERVLLQPADIQEQIELPPIEKEPPTYPNLDSHLNQLAEDSSGVHQQSDTEQRTTEQDAEPVLVTLYVEPDQVDDVQQYLEDNGIFVRNVGADYIEAHIPPSMLGSASEQPGVLRVDTVIPPRRLQSQTRVISQVVGLHGADVWHSAGYRGNGVKVGIIDSGFEGFRGLQGTELPTNVTARCYFEGPQRPSADFADCIGESSHL